MAVPADLAKSIVSSLTAEGPVSVSIITPCTGIFGPINGLLRAMITLKNQKPDIQSHTEIVEGSKMYQNHRTYGITAAWLRLHAGIGCFNALMPSTSFVCHC